MCSYVSVDDSLIHPCLTTMQFCSGFSVLFSAIRVCYKSSPIPRWFWLNILEGIS